MVSGFGKRQVRLIDNLNESMRFGKTVRGLLVVSSQMLTRELWLDHVG